MATARIPLRGRDGAVRAYAVVDADMMDELSQHRWHLTSEGYARRCVGSSRLKPRPVVFMHRHVLGLAQGDGRECDHLNTDRLDNRRSNLRAIGQAANRQNVRSGRGSSRFVGVSWNRQRGAWRADLRNKFLGHFEDEIEAARVAAAARADAYPAFVDHQGLLA